MAAGPSREATRWSNWTIEIKVLRIYSVQWRMDGTAADKWLLRASAAALMGPFREPWEFGYLMVDPAAFDR